MAEVNQSAARQAAIAAGNSAEDVDAFIAREGGDRVSAQRIGSAFNVAGYSGTNDLTAFHAQKADAPASAYHSGMTPGMPGATTSPVGGGGGGTGGPPPTGTVPDTPAASTGADASSVLAGLSGVGSDLSQSLAGGQPQEAGGPNLRQGLGSRLYPQNSAALAGLQRAY